MLEFMRRNANSWVMVVLFAVIIFVFAINFGPWAGNITTGVPYAAVINNEAVSLAEFRTAYSSQMARIKQFRPSYDQTQAQRDGLKSIVLEQLITRELLTQLGAQNHLSISGKTLADEIKTRVFRPEEPFTKDEYTRRVNAFFQSSVQQFEEQVAKEMVAEQMANLLGSVVHVSDDEVLKNFMEKNTEISLDYVKVNPNFFKTTQKIDEKEITRYVKTNDREITEYYNQNLSTYKKEKQVKARHILVKVDASASSSDKAQKRSKAESILARLKKGEDFSLVAQKESDDAGTRENGGDLGFFSAGMMVEEFSNAAFALKKGELSGVVESPFGFHIIKHIDVKEGSEQTKDDVALEIAEILLKKNAQEKKALDYAEKALAQLRSKKPIKTLRLPSLLHVDEKTKDESLGNKPHTGTTTSLTLGTRYIARMGMAEEVIEAASNLTLNNPVASKVIESNGNYFALRLKSRKDADKTKFEEEKESIRSQIAYPRKRAFMQQYMSDLRANANIQYNQSLLQSDTNEG